MTKRARINTTSPGRAVRTTIGRIVARGKQHRALWARVEGFRRFLEASPASPLVRHVIKAAKTHLRGSMNAKRVLEALDALELGSCRFALAGGWGIDALVGRQTRRHDDLDIALLDYQADELSARGLLLPLGFKVRERVPAGKWMPMRTMLDDGAGHRIELVSINRSALGEALSPFSVGMNGSGSHSAAADHAGVHHASLDRPAVDLSSMEELAFVAGAIKGRSVPCLSASVQRLYHSGFDLRGVDRHDLALLEMTNDAAR
jgi:lincosamide nucleotidyltransferase A/C/D/E